jgi:hypothetical protein
MKPIHHPHLRHKPMNPSSKMKSSQLMAQSLRLPEVPIPTLTPSDSAGTYREVNHVAVECPITQTKWSHIPITFSTHIDRWDVSKILVNNGSQAEILFLSTFEKMGYDKKQLKEPTKPLYGFGGKRIELVGVITMHVSFGTPKNPAQNTEPSML